MASAKRSTKDRDADGTTKKRNKYLCPSAAQISIRCSKARNGDIHRDNTQRHLPTEITQRQLSTETSHTDTFHSAYHIAPQRLHTETVHRDLALTHRDFTLRS